MAAFLTAADSLILNWVVDYLKGGHFSSTALVDKPFDEKAVQELGKLHAKFGYASEIAFPRSLPGQSRLRSRYGDSVSQRARVTSSARRSRDLGPLLNKQRLFFYLTLPAGVLLCVWVEGHESRRGRKPCWWV
jgi:hypothetical protein